MKKTFFWISMLFSFILSIGCGEKGTESGIPDTSKSSAVRCDTQAVIRAYFEKMGYSTKNIGHFDSSTTIVETPLQFFQGSIMLSGSVLIESEMRVFCPTRRIKLSCVSLAMILPWSMMAMRSESSWASSM